MSLTFKTFKGEMPKKTWSKKNDTYAHMRVFVVEHLGIFQRIREQSLRTKQDNASLLGMLIRNSVISPLILPQ